MKDYSKATNKQLNAAIAKLRGWTYVKDQHEVHHFLPKRPGWISLGGIWDELPDYTGDPRLWTGLELPQQTRIYLYEEVAIAYDGTKGRETIIAETIGRAWCLAYLAHKGVMEVEDEPDG